MVIFWEIIYKPVGLWNTTFPVSRVTMQVHHRDNYVLIRHNPKNDTERERRCETATNAIFDFVVQKRVDLDSVEGILNGRQETLSEILLLGLIKHRRRHHLRFGFGMEANRFHPSAA